MPTPAGVENPEADLTRLRRVREVFDAVSSTGSANRTVLLEQECGTDSGLRTLVEELLLADEAEHPVLDRPLVVSTRSVGALSAGDNAGPYQIVREIGSGGMGSVYLASRRDDANNVPYALKVVRWPSPEFVHRLEQEIRILSHLEHPHIARLLDVGLTSAGLPFLVMEYVEGEPIHHYVKRQSLSMAARVQLFRQVCVAVTYLHQNLVVHRDLKPANVLVSRDGNVKVVDFGIAKLLEPSPATSGMTFGPLTPEYASPEQIRGGPLSTLTDVYTLGVVLYEILSGGRPFQGGVLEVVRKVCEEDAPKPAGIPAELYTIAWKAMRKEPAQRYASVDQLDEDLRRYLEGLPVLARGDSRWYRTRKFVLRNRTLVVSAALLAIAIFTGIVATTLEARVAERERIRAEATAASAEKERLRAEKNEAEALRMRAEAERRLTQVEQLARGVVRAYGATVQPGTQHASALLAASARDSILALDREGMLAPGLGPLLDNASAELRGHDLAARKSWEVPEGWRAGTGNGNEYRIGVDRQFRYQGKPALFLQSSVPRPSGGITAFQEFNAVGYRGKRVRFSAMVRTVKVDGSLMLSLGTTPADGYNFTRAFASGTGAWRSRELVVDVPAGANSVRFLISLIGSGTAWIANVSFAEVPTSVPLSGPPQPHNLDFTAKQ